MKTKKKRPRGRPAKSMPRRIDAPPERIAEALFADNDAKLKNADKSHHAAKRSARS